MKIKSFFPVVLTAVIVALMPAMSASAAADADSFNTTSVGGVEVTASIPITSQAQLDEFVLSSTPKVITVDTATGSLETVEEVAPSEVSARGVSNPCASGAACWMADRTPYANFGFSGAGTYTGTWEYRGDLASHNQTVRAYYRLYSGSSDVAFPKIGPNTIIEATGGAAYGVKVIIY